MEVHLVALLGYKDHGKSTLIGSLLMQTGAATRARIKEAEHYSKRLHKAFEPAFILDSFAEERLNEMTYDTTRAEIKHKDLAFSLIDVPGHEELIKNMISGASYGELALLLVSAKKGEGVVDQTKRHLFIARMLGIERLIVAVNKMDTINYEQKKFDGIKAELGRFISKVGFNSADVNFVPISAYNGENLTRKSKKMVWYMGKPLIEVLYENAKRGESKSGTSLRLIVQGKIPGEKKEIVAGKVISGSIKIGEKVVILPSGEITNVKGIIVNGRRAEAGKNGENVAIELDGGISGEMRGNVISSLENRPKAADKVKLRIFVTGKFGKMMRVKFNGVDIPCKSVRILDGIDTTTGERNGSRKEKILGAVDAIVTLSRVIPVESYNATRELGRFVLYNGNKFAGIGVALDV